MTEERLKKRQVENGILANAKNDPVCVANDALFSGKIVSVYKRGDETKFIVTCGHPGMKRNADGKIDRNIITVKFFGKEGEFYANGFKRMILQHFMPLYRRRLSVGMMPELQKYGDFL